VLASATAAVTPLQHGPAGAWTRRSFVGRVWEGPLEKRREAERKAQDPGEHKRSTGARVPAAAEKLRAASGDVEGGDLLGTRDHREASGVEECRVREKLR